VGSDRIMAMTAVVEVNQSVGKEREKPLVLSARSPADTMSGSVAIRRRCVQPLNTLFTYVNIPSRKVADITDSLGGCKP
jgi:hypothetical protein